ncbi:hypothetical protein LINGRAPRIM_LOCUS2066 [Linum grandiflorum]
MFLTNWCVLCRNSLELVDHILLHCQFSSLVWAKINSVLAIHGPLPSDTRGLITAWKGMNCSSSFSSAMKVILHAMSWSIWLERNARIFKDKDKSVCKVCCKIFVVAGRWLVAAGLFSPDLQARWTCFRSRLSVC